MILIVMDNKEINNEIIELCNRYHRGKVNSIRLELRNCKINKVQ